MPSPEKWSTPFAFYVRIFRFCVQHLFYNLYDYVFHPKKFKTENKIIVTPKCLSAVENGSHHYAKLSRTKFHYVEKGDPTNPLLLLLHGYPEFWYSWRFQLRSLSEQYWVIALDLKGFGDSDKPATLREYDIMLLIDEVRDFVTAMGKSKCTLVCHGLGGLVGWYFVHEHSNMVENFISISSPHPISFLQELNAGRATFSNWYYFTPLPFLPEREVMKEDLQVFTRMLGKMLGNKRGNFTKEDLDAYKYSFSRFEDWTGPMNYFRTLILRQGKYSKSLKKVRIPVLFLIGNVDPYCSLEMICKSSEYVENFKLKIIEDGGHYLNQEKPYYVNSLILDFIKKPEHNLTEDSDDDRSLLRKMLGAGKTVVTSTVNYGNQVWSNSKDAVAKGYIPKLTTP